MSFQEFSNLMLDPSSPISWLVFLLLVVIAIIGTSIFTVAGYKWGSLIMSFFLMAAIVVLYAPHLGTAPNLVYFFILAGLVSLGMSMQFLWGTIEKVL